MTMAGNMNGPRPTKPNRGPVLARTRDLICCQDCAAPRKESRMLAWLPRIVSVLFITAILAGTITVVILRDRLLDWYKESGQGRKPYKTFKISPIKTACAAVTENDDDAFASRDLLDGSEIAEAFEDADWRDIWMEITVAYTYGIARLTAQEFADNHCDNSQMELLLNPFKQDDKRSDEVCRAGSQGSAAGNGAACAGGMYAHTVNGTVIEARPAPAGYFAPERFTCLVRCPKGGYCPRSYPKVQMSGDVKKCKWPKDVDRTQKVIEITDPDSGEVLDRVCPGSRFLYLCPGGFRCKYSETLVPCDKGYSCPRGSSKQQRCHGAGLMASPSTVCSSEETEFPDYSLPAGIFVASFALVALIVLGFAGTLARARDSMIGACKDAYAGYVHHHKKHRHHPDHKPSSSDKKNKMSSANSNIGASVRRAGETSSAACGACFDAERNFHDAIVKRVAADAMEDEEEDDFGTTDPQIIASSSFAGLSARGAARCVVYGGLALVACVAAAFAAGPVIFFPALLFLGFVVVGGFGLCTLNTRAALFSYDEELTDGLCEDDEESNEPPVVGPSDDDDEDSDDAIVAASKAKIAPSEIFREPDEEAIVPTSCGCGARMNVGVAFGAILVCVVAWAAFAAAAASTNLDPDDDDDEQRAYVFLLAIALLATLVFLCTAFGACALLCCPKGCCPRHCWTGCDNWFGCRPNGVDKNEFRRRLASARSERARLAAAVVAQQPGVKKADEALEAHAAAAQEEALASVAETLEAGEAKAAAGAKEASFIGASAADFATTTTATTRPQQQEQQHKRRSSPSSVVTTVSVGGTTTTTRRRKMRRKSQLGDQEVDLRVDLQYRHLQVKIRRTGKIALNDASGRISSGNVTALMGPSGAGKTTLMNALAFRSAGYADVTGDVYVNGQSVSSLKHLSKFTAFVPQDDICLPELTVKQTLVFYAAIRAADRASATRTAVERRAEEAMHLVELPASVKSSVIGDAERRGISGGQKKRVSIAMELVSRPSLLFLDEPTSGLDSSTSFQVVQALSRLSQTGVNVVTVIHSPSYTIFSMFSKVLLLGVGGTTTYHDDPKRVLDYFTTPHPDRGFVFACPEFANPADVVMDIISGMIAPASCSDDDDREQKLLLAGAQNDDSEADLAAVTAAAQAAEEPPYGEFPTGNREAAAVALARMWTSRSTGTRAAFGALSKELSKRTLSSYASRRDAETLHGLRGQPSFVAQTWLFAGRALSQQTNRIEELVFDFALMLAFGALFGSQSAHVTIAGLPLMVLWLGIAIQLFLAVAMLRVFGAERVVFWREAAQGSGMALNISAYFWGKDIVQLPRVALLALAFTSLFYAFATPTPGFDFYFLTVFLTSYAIAGYAYVVSIALEPKAAQLFAVVAALILTLLSGIGADTLPDLMEAPFPVRVLPWISPIRWAGETLIVAQTRHLSHAWKLSPTFYVNPQRDSALASLFTFAFHEGWLYTDDIKVTREGDQPQVEVTPRLYSNDDLDDDPDSTVCVIKGKWMWSDGWNFAVLLCLGLVARLVALGLLHHLHRDKMGEPPLTARLSLGCRRVRDGPRRVVEGATRFSERASQQQNSPGSAVSQSPLTRGTSSSQSEAEGAADQSQPAATPPGHHEVELTSVEEGKEEGKEGTPNEPRKEPSVRFDP